MQEYKLYIGGQWTETLYGEQFESTNPYTGKLWINTYRNATYASPFGGTKPADTAERTEKRPSKSTPR
jgi:acyl-CoA reductase-like NAD-dependent aldehyde dehydrogenase